MKRAALLLAAGLVAGCATSPPAPVTSNMNFGEPPPHYETVVPAFIKGALLDPQSAIITVHPPRRAAAQAHWLRGGGIGWTGWVVRADVNAKNRFGGYTGTQDWWMLWRDGQYVGTYYDNDARMPKITFLD